MSSQSQSQVNKWAVFIFSVEGGFITNSLQKGYLRKVLQEIASQISPILDDPLRLYHCVQWLFNKNNEVLFYGLSPAIYKI